MNSGLIIEENKTFASSICKIIFDEYKSSIDEKNYFTFVLSGGSTPKLIFNHLIEFYSLKIEWSKVIFFWLDERCVKPDNRDSNFWLADNYLLSKLNKVGGIVRMKGELNPDAAVLEYTKELLDFFNTKEKIIFDFILLGMGLDGHIASVFPESEELLNKETFVLRTKRKHNGHYRLSLGIDLINKGRYKLLILKGTEKIKVFNNVNRDKLLPKDYIEFSKIISTY